MSMVGTFDGFTAARLGIYAAQHGLRVTGNNVSNINTLGYTRQRVDQLSFKAGANDMYRSQYDNHVGSGALVTGINQVRDPYLDIRYRNASTDTYHYDTWLSGLQHIASILDEVGKGENEDGLIYRGIQDLAKKLRTYSANPTELNDRLVRNSAESLTLLFHNAADQLEKLYNETVNEYNESISAVNEILTNIRDLNKSIREAEIHGDHALEMRDERNRQIDALSQYLNIKVEYSFETVGGGIEVEKLTIRLSDANPDGSVHSDESILVDGVFATQLSVPEKKPVLNTYGDDHPYLGGYRYLKEYAPKDLVELQQFLTDNGIASKDDLVQALDENGNVKTDANGNPIYLVGTNDPDVDGIYTETNDNFSLQLGKLLNAKGEAWKKVTTAWTELTSGTPVQAQYTYNIAMNKDARPLTFTIEGEYDDEDPTKQKVFTVPESLTNEADILAYVAQQMNGAEKYKDYTVTASADGTKLIFTAKNPGEVGKPEDVAKGAPAADPGFTVTPAGSWITPTLDDTATIKGSFPNDARAVETDEHGNVTKSINYVSANGRWYRLTVSNDYTHEVTLDDNDLRGILQAQREMLTEEGEFASAKDVAIDESALTKRGLPYYMKSLDLLAQKFAEAYNQLNYGFAYDQEGYYIDREGNRLTLEGDYISATDGLTADQRKILIENGYYFSKDGYLADENGSLITDEKGKPIPADPDDEILMEKAILNVEWWLKNNNPGEAWEMGGDLFTTLDGTTTEGITAKNISISHGWSNGLWNLVPTFKMLFTESGSLTHSTQNDNADHMVAMIDKGLTYNPRDLYGSDAIGPDLFTGSFNDMLSNMMARQGEDADITNIRLATASGILNEVDYNREGVSGVDLNDEAMNMVQYQKAMTAAMRVMTAIDEVLDRLINNTGIAGR